MIFSFTLHAQEKIDEPHLLNLRTMLRNSVNKIHPSSSGATMDLLLGYAATNQISTNALTHLIMDMIDQSRQARDSGKPHAELPRYTLLDESNLLLLLGNFKSTNTIPFLQRMSGSENVNMRVYSMHAYLYVTGVDSIPYQRGYLTRTNQTERERYMIYRDIASRISNAEQTKQDRNRIDEAKAFLLERAQDEKKRSAANELDKILCGMFPDYKTSVQREKVAAHFMNDDNEICRKRFTEIHENIQKTPKEKRKDFRAKGELLDPERGKNRSDVQP